MVGNVENVEDDEMVDMLYMIGIIEMVGIYFISYWGWVPIFLDETKLPYRVSKLYIKQKTNLAQFGLHWGSTQRFGKSPYRYRYIGIGIGISVSVKL